MRKPTNKAGKLRPAEAVVDCVVVRVIDFEVVAVAVVNFVVPLLAVVADFVVVEDPVQMLFEVEGRMLTGVSLNHCCNGQKQVPVQGWVRQFPFCW